MQAELLTIIVEPTVKARAQFSPSESSMKVRLTMQRVLETQTHEWLTPMLMKAKM